MKKLFRNSYGAILWKEIRENAIWAVLAALALIGINYLFGGDFAFKGSFDTFNATDLLYHYIEFWVEPIITLGVGPVLATILGMMQVLPERRRDQWAFLIHRPLSHTALFWHKAAAGCFLYTVSLGGALLLLWYLKWVPIGQHFPDVPFDWRFMLGGIANLLLGVPFYFAAMLCVMRPARWYGSKLVPLLGCLVLHYFWFQLQEFYQCFWLVVLYSVVYAVAVRNSFAESGQAPLHRKAGQFATGLALLSGLVPLLGLGLVLLNLWLSIVLPQRRGPMILSREPQVTSYYDIVVNGEVVRSVTRNSLKPRYYGADGKEKKIIPTGAPVLSDIAFEQEIESFRYPRRYLKILDRYMDVYQAVPYIPVYSAKLGRILLFTDSWRFVGFAGVAGSSVNSPARRELLQTYIGGGYLWLSDGIYRIQGREMVLRPISNALDIEGISFFYTPRSERKTKSPSASQRTGYLRPQQSLIVMRSKSIDFFDTHDKLLFSTPREHNRKLYSQIGTQANSERTRYFIVYRPTRDIPELKRREMPDYVVILDNKGNILKRHTFPSLPLKRNIGALSSREATGIGLGMAPIAWAGYAVWNFYGYASYSLALNQWFKQIILDRPELFFMVALSYVSAFVCSLIVYSLRRRSGLTKRLLLAWIIAVFLLGPVGLLLFLAMQGWPSRVACLNCGKQRAVHFNHCENCGAPWPVRPKDSADIFPTAPTTNS